MYITWNLARACPTSQSHTQSHTQSHSVTHCRAHRQSHTHTQSHSYTHTQSHSHTVTNTVTHTRARIYTHAQKLTNMRACTHIKSNSQHTHTHTTHTHTHIPLARTCIYTCTTTYCAQIQAPSYPNINSKIIIQYNHSLGCITWALQFAVFQNYLNVLNMRIW